jgi:transcriptional regulator with XRE-family HTH domain
MDQIGTRIRAERRKTKLTLQQLAKKVGVSPITLHRIETGKTSPSVIVLSEIAQHLGKSIASFFEEGDRPLIHIKKKNQKTVASPALWIKSIGPRRMIKDNMIVSYGELKKGTMIDPHTNPGVEYAYNLQGKCELRLDGKSFLLGAGDSVSYNAKLEHSVKAIEKLKFFAIYVQEEK